MFIFVSIDCTKVDFEDLIDMFGACNLEFTMPRTSQNILPLWTKDLVSLNDKPIKIPHPILINFSIIPNSSSLLSLDVTLKKMKIGETSTPQIHDLVFDEFEFDEDILNSVVLLNIPIIYIEEGIFERIELMRDL